MLKIGIIIFIFVLVALGVIFLNFGKIEEKLALFSESSQRLPLEGEIREEMENIFNQEKYMFNRNIMVHLIVVGDIMLSRNVGQKITEHRDYQYPFRQTQDILQQADITLGNLESPLISGPPVHSPSMVFRADPEAAPALSGAGFDVLSLANNHIMNQGEKGLEKTLALLEVEGIKTVGAGRNFAEAHQYKIIERKGVKIAFLAYTYPGNPEATQDSSGLAIMEEEDLKKDIIRAKAGADLVIISMHAGTEYTRYPNEMQINFAHVAIDFGADLVIGHHPHWFQTVEKYKDKYILYSLGNFVFDQMWSEETREGMIASIFLDKEGIEDLEFMPVKIYDFSQPRFVNGKERKRLLKMLGLELEKAPLFFKQDNSFLQTERQGIYGDKIFVFFPEIQEVDFDNDGKRERLVGQDNSLILFRGEEKIWETEPDWIISDYGVDDFDNDGFLELALALWKKGDYAAGSPLETPENREHWGSHLFLYNFKEGELKLLWGSSLLDYPILEIAAVDIDQDGAGELVALEGNYSDPYSQISRKMSIMSWNGWGFSQDWEKQGKYYNLRVYPAPEFSIAVSEAD